MLTRFALAACAVLLLTGVLATADGPAPEQLPLKDLAPKTLGAIKKIAGSRIVGEVQIAAIEPTKEKGKYKITVVDLGGGQSTVDGIGSNYAAKDGHLRRISCTWEIGEAKALARKVGERFKIAGDIESCDLKTGLDIAPTHADSIVGDGFHVQAAPVQKKRPRRDEALTIVLKHVAARPVEPER
jgi:hypothetical protein